MEYWTKKSTRFYFLKMWRLTFYFNSVVKMPGKPQKLNQL